MRYLILLFTAQLLWGQAFNVKFLNIKRLTPMYKFYMANKIYKDKKYKKALEAYENIEPKSDKIYFNIANTYYRLKDYRKAIDYYKMVTKPEYNTKKFYNIANAYVMQKNYLKAIVFYKNALKFSQDKKIKENLEYAKQHLLILRDIMLNNAKCSVTMAKLDNFDDQNVSKDMQEAKLKYAPKFNVLNNLNEKIEDYINSDSNSSDTNKTKVLKVHQKLIDTRVEQQLKERSSKTLLIPIQESK